MSTVWILVPRLAFFEFRLDSLEAREIEVGQHEAGDAFVGEGVDGCAPDA